VPTKVFYPAVTLIELLVVITVLAILAMVAGPNLSGWNCKQEVRNNFAELNGFLTTLRIGAVNRNRTMMARIEGGVIKAYQSPQNGKRNCGDSISNSVTDILDYEKKENTITHTEKDVCFNADGSATPATYTITRQCDDKEYKYRSQVFGATGFISKDKFNINTNDWEEM